MAVNIKLSVPNGEKKVLVHACCAPCSSAILEILLTQGFEPTIFYYNPNIYPLKEYEIRKSESMRYADSLGISFYDGDYNHRSWLASIKGMEDLPERSHRCNACFFLRLLVTAQFASENGFHVFTTTLASSRWKDLEQIFIAGNRAAESCENVIFWDQNWRKHGLSERKIEIIKENDFYQQQYCGCEFSLRDVELWKKQCAMKEKKKAQITMVENTTL